MNSDISYMQHALRLASRGLGNVWPNPSVGAVLVKDGRVVGTGVTARGGRPHAETQAIEEAGADAKGATLYVTLEPCSHHGKTGPCAEAIIKAGIVRVVAACGDVNPQVAGKGFEILRKAGISVTENICEAQARQLNEGFFSVIQRGRPFVSLKIATSLDGKSATASGESKWITGDAARARGHMLRAEHDAILTGIGTALADDPALTCRLPGREADSPTRILLDGKLRIGEKAKLLPAWIFTSKEALAERKTAAAALEKTGSRLFTVELENGKLSLKQVLSTLAKEGITRLLVEAGETVSDAFIEENLIDKLYWFRAPVVIAESSRTLADMPRFTSKAAQRVGSDMLEIYEYKAS